MSYYLSGLGQLSFSASGSANVGDDWKMQGEVKTTIDEPSQSKTSRSGPSTPGSGSGATYVDTACPTGYVKGPDGICREGGAAPPKLVPCPGGDQQVAGDCCPPFYVGSRKAGCKPKGGGPFEPKWCGTQVLPAWQCDALQNRSNTPTDCWDGQKQIEARCCPYGFEGRALPDNLSQDHLAAIFSSKQRPIPLTKANEADPVVRICNQSAAPAYCYAALANGKLFLGRGVPADVKMWQGWGARGEGCKPRAGGPMEMVTCPDGQVLPRYKCCGPTSADRLPADLSAAQRQAIAQGLNKPVDLLPSDPRWPVAQLCNQSGAPSYCFIAKTSGKNFLGRGTATDPSAWFAWPRPVCGSQSAADVGLQVRSQINTADLVSIPRGPRYASMMSLPQTSTQSGLTIGPAPVAAPPAESKSRVGLYAVVGLGAAAVAVGAYLYMRSRKNG
jgi:hypothetical protein